METCIPSTSGVSETAACPLSPIADAPSALPSHTSSSSSSQFTPSFPPVHSMPAQVCQCCTAVLHLSRYYTVRLKRFTLTALLFLWLFSFYCFHSYSSATTFLISTFEYRRFCFLQNKVSNFKSVYSLCLFVLMYYMCKKYCTPITVQYHIADCVTQLPRVTLLDLTNMLLEQNLFVCQGLTVPTNG